MEFKLVLLTSSLGLALWSCQSSSMTKGLESITADTKLAETMARDFFFQLRFGEKKKLVAIYPGLQHFDRYHQSEGISIQSATEKDGLFTISIRNRCKTERAGITEKNVSLYFRKDASGNLKMIDSKGIYNFEKMEEYLFGLKTGCINNTDTTDQQILSCIRKAKVIMPEQALDIYVKLKKGLQVINWNWEPGFDGSGFGEGMVRNASNMQVPQLKYRITYNNQRGGFITSDTGYVSFDPIVAGDSTSFTFYTANVPRAAKASIEFLFDDEIIFRYLNTKKWTGKECQEYFQQNPQKLKEL